MDAEKDASEFSEATWHLEQAYAAEEQGDSATALGECDLSIQLDSGHAEAHNLRGIVLEELGRKEEALAAYQEAVRLDSTLADAQENLVELANELRGGEASEVQDLTEAEEPRYRSIGGPLILTALAMVVSPLLLLCQIVSDLLPALSGETWTALTTPGTAAYHPMWAPLIIFELLANVALLIWLMVLAVFFFQKRRVFPKMFMVYLLSNVAFIVIDHLLANSIPFLADQGAERFAAGIVRPVIYCLIWIPYFLTSKRVKGTFVH